MTPTTFVTIIDGTRTYDNVETTCPKQIIRSKAMVFILNKNPEANISDTTTPASCDVGSFALKWDKNKVEVFEITETDSIGWFYTTKVVTPVLRCTVYVEEDAEQTAEQTAEPEPQPEEKVTIHTEETNLPLFPRRNKLKAEIKAELVDELKNEGLLKQSLTESTLYRVNEVVRREYDQVIRDLQEKINELESNKVEITITEDPVFEPREIPVPQQYNNVITFGSVIECVRNFDRSSLRPVRRCDE